MYLIIMNGHVACLKTTLARKLSDLLEVPLLETNKFGRVLNEENLMDLEKRNKRYSALLEMAETYVSNNYSVILDGTFGLEEWRRKVYAICSKHGVTEIAVIRCVSSSDEVVKWRLMEREFDALAPEKEVFYWDNYLQSVSMYENVENDIVSQELKVNILEFDSATKVLSVKKRETDLAKKLEDAFGVIHPRLEAYESFLKIIKRNVLSADFLRQHIDFTNVKPHASLQEIEGFCKKAVENKVKTIYVQPHFLKAAVLLARGVEVGTTAGFPFGNIPLELKLAGMRYAAENGASWVDVCLNDSLVRSGDFDGVEAEIRGLSRQAKASNIGLKIIIETPYLSKEEIYRVVHLVDLYDVDFLKTCTGVGTKVTGEHVKLIMQVLKKSKLKVSGGVSSLRETQRFFELGADVVGSSKGFEILEETKGRENKFLEVKQWKSLLN